MTAALPPTTLRNVLTALMLAIFLGALDQTIVAVSLPAISAQFNDVGLLAWVISGYMVAMTVAVPIYGKLGDLYGRRRMILTGISLFTLASIACAMAQDMQQLVLARVLQGIGAGGMVSVSQAIIGDFVPPRERGRYQGYFSSMYAVASVAGPVLGGWLTEYLSWRWVFWINLPLGLVALWAIRRALGGMPAQRREAQVDYLGAVLLILGLGSLLLGITLVGQGHAWIDPAVLALFACAVLGLALFIAHERRCPEPLLPLGLFSNRVAVLCWGVIFFASFQSISLTMLMPLRYQGITGAGADSAALHLLPLAMGLPLGAFTGGRMTSRTGRYKPQILAGALLMPVAIFAMALTPPQSALLSALFMLLTGIACGLQFPTSLVGTQSAVESKDIGVATSTTNLFRSLGGAMGVACMSSLLLALLHQGGFEMLGNPLLGSLKAGEVDLVTQARLTETFRHLLMGSALIAVLGLAAAVALPDRQLRGR
ncbi:MFS transporter [Pseudomonas monteilii]|uniref:MFS transporter n=1 Tax=Pseudomonas monteilii TaxID=76759 RepID=A0AAP7FIG2_9PSED|nr:MULTISPECIES: MDR family MFS transporter [Pseudomonas]KPM63798.1 disulfide bond formation protein DsbA [Pseudomonas putida]AYN17736.1 MFS transporter [Pseudomonas monteilii]AYN98556.1 DHA2 family efflux MFS transporter permease subunit [Pseudomonas sp. LTGT-11-2Z]MBA1315339.1 MFS transporter [Pseudomonas monteilii]MBA6087914.1 MFS transporter [Pseudomonas monteilii]